MQFWLCAVCCVWRRKAAYGRWAPPPPPPQTTITTTHPHRGRIQTPSSSLSPHVLTTSVPVLAPSPWRGQRTPGWGNTGGRTPPPTLPPASPSTTSSTGWTVSWAASARSGASLARPPELSLTNLRHKVTSQQIREIFNRIYRRKVKFPLHILWEYLVGFTDTR